ncbi:hypothetical protein GRI34_08255 [Erythrobacter aquimaris]|uniref:Uncharacterized protein n=1 Tax=Qipengyuania aquimaris TaxID=255984 RepID=A0A6I4TKN4_9SPHN|nr:hypothetical protein [Qipengyuania aquimaris]MXO96406.1 hypothetical protein [Qipengyuania aquimaris]
MARIPVVCLTVAAVLWSAAPAQAGEMPEKEIPAELYLQGVERTEAEELVRELEAAQAKLRSGEKIYFALLSGASASHESANLGARDAFLSMDWAKTLKVSEMDPGNSYWTGYRLQLLPDGFGNMVWDVRIWRNVSGNFERIELFNRPPNPF